MSEIFVVHEGKTQINIVIKWPDFSVLQIKLIDTSSSEIKHIAINKTIESSFKFHFRWK